MAMAKTIEIFTDPTLVTEIQQYDHWHFLVSGGKESTAMCLEIKYLLDNRYMQQPLSIELVNTNTGLRMKTSKYSLDQLVEYTGWPLTELKPIVSTKDTLSEAFANLDKAQQMKKNKKYDRKVFKCCIELKEKPGILYARSIPKNERLKHLFFTGIAPYESNQRRLRLAYYRNRNLWIRPNETNAGVPYCRPFRDIFDKQLVMRVLKRFGFDFVVSSGCSICPVVLLFKMYDKDPKTYARSRKYFLSHYRNMDFCGELPTSLDQYIDI